MVAENFEIIGVLITKIEVFNRTIALIVNITVFDKNINVLADFLIVTAKNFDKNIYIVII